MKLSSMAALTVALLVALSGGAAIAGGSTFSGVVAGGTQFASAGTSLEKAVHTLDTGGAGACTRTVTFSYNGGVGDTLGGLGMEGAFVTAGRDYLTHLYLIVEDAKGADISGTEWIEDDTWETSATGVPGLLPVMTHTATISGACGEWTFIVDAHRGAGQYEITVA